RDADARRLQGGRDSPGARLIEWPAKIESVGNRVEHRFRRNVRLGRMESGRELDAIDVELARKIKPVFDSAVGILVSDLAWSELLECSGQHSDLHEFWFKFASWHCIQYSTFVHTPPCLALSRIASMMQFDRYPSSNVAKISGRWPETMQLYISRITLQNASAQAS